MFFKLILENENGDRIDMTTTANQYMTSKIEGLNPPAGTVSTSSYAGMNGSYLNNAFIEKRNIVIHFEMRGVNIERKRHLLYKVVKPSRYTALTDFTIAKSVKEIQNYAFSSCGKLKTLKYEGSLKDWTAITKQENWDWHSSSANLTKIQCLDGYLKWDAENKEWTEVKK